MASAFKKSLINLLQSHISNKDRLLVDWKCAHCRKEHEANLFQDAATLETDVETGDWKADIGLFNDNQQFIAAIHISKNKRAHSETAAFYQSQNVNYIQIVPGDDITASLQHPKYVSACTNPKCETCNHYQQEKNLYVIDSSCWKCEGAMKIAIINIGQSTP